jgi:hypothetical protein
LTQPLTGMSARNILLGGKGGRCVGLTILPPSCADCLEMWEPNLLEPSGPVQVCNGIDLIFTSSVTNPTWNDLLFLVVR